MNITPLKNFIPHYSKSAMAVSFKAGLEEANPSNSEQIKSGDIEGDTFFKHDKINNNQLFFGAMINEIFKNQNEHLNRDWSEFVKKYQNANVIKKSDLEQNLDTIKNVTGTSTGNCPDEVIELILEDIEKKPDTLLEEATYTTTKLYANLAASKFREPNIWTANSPKEIEKNIFEKKPFVPVYINLENTKHKTPLKTTDLKNKTNFNVVEASTPEELLNKIEEAQNIYKKTNKKTIILAQNLLTSLYKVSFSDKIKEAFKKSSNPPLICIFNDGFELYNKNGKNSDSVMDLPVYKDEMQKLEEEFLAPHFLKKQNNNITPPKLLILGETAKNQVEPYVYDMAKKIDANVLKLDEECSSKEFARSIEAISTKQKEFADKAKHTFIYIPQAYKYLYNNTNNQAKLNYVIERTKDLATFVLVSSMTDELSSVVKPKDNLKIIFRPFTDEEISDLFKHYIEKAIEEIDERISLGENLRPLDKSVFENLDNILSFDKKKEKLTAKTIEKTVERTKNAYIENNNQNFNSHLRHFISILNN